MSQTNPAYSFCRPKTSCTRRYCYQITYYFLSGHIDKRARIACRATH